MNPDDHREYLRRQGQRGTTPHGPRTMLTGGAWTHAIPEGFADSVLRDLTFISAAEAADLRAWVAR